MAAWYRDEDVHLEGAGRTVTVNRRRPKVNATGTQEELLTALSVPVLVVHGDTGASERRCGRSPRPGRHWLPAGSAVEVVAGSEHTFIEHQDEVAALATSWVRRHVPVE